MQERLLKQTAFFTAIFTIIAVCLMVWFEWNKDELLLWDYAMMQSEQSDYEEVVSVDTASGFVPTNVKKVADTGEVSLHFATDIQDKIELQCDYPNQQIELFFPQLTTKDIEKCLIEADAGIINCEEMIAFRQMKGSVPGTALLLPTNGYYEGEMTWLGNQVTVVCSRLKPDKRVTVVLDAGHGGMDIGEDYYGIAEKDLTLKIMNMVKEQLKKEDMRVFCTRNADVSVTEEARVAFANAIKADMLISIHLSFEEEDQLQKQDGLTTFYNGEYFIPEFGSIELANIISEETIKKVGGVANGLYEAQDDIPLVSGAQVPVALMEIDHVMSESNKLTLTSDKNLKMIAEGISAGILKAKEMLE